jgi:glutamate-ammonia-ligase adenylyltransferase
MQLEQLRLYLDSPDAGLAWIRNWQVDEPQRAYENLVRLATGGLPLDLVANLAEQLEAELPNCPDPDRALNNLERFFSSARSPLSLASLFERDREALSILLQIFSTSQHLSDVLITDPQAYDLLRLTEGQAVSRQTLIDEICAEIATLPTDTLVMTALRRYKRRETLRIAYGDIVRGQALDTVTKQISYLADAIVEGALQFAWRMQEEKRGVPRTASGKRARFVVLGMGKLGGVELNYSSDIDLIFLYDAEGSTDGARKISNQEFFERLARDLVRLLSEVTPDGYTYRVDLRLRPEGQRGPIAPRLEWALQYYDVLGRTWERQAYVKARPVAGDLELGEEFLRLLEPWVFRRYLALADIAGIKALKRRIEHRAIRENSDSRDVKSGRGGIRDVEFAIQFLQLLNAGDLAELRTGNTLLALAKLEKVGCLTPSERTILEENYSFLRKLEHRLQIMFDLQTHLLPATASEQRKLALRMGFADGPEQTALEAFEGSYANRTELNRKILDHLLHDAFGDDAETEPEVDLVLDPDPPHEQVVAVLGGYGFRNIDGAYRNLMQLSQERIRFLSTRRCRHFLASIAPRLLQAIAATPDPDATLVSLEKVSDSLGGKGVLWELFNFNPPTLKLCVELCASSPMLSGILTSNPGMIDELMDSLVLNKLPRLADLRAMLTELCRGAEDIDPILHSFKNAQTLRVGVRDILGKEDIRTTTNVLSEIAQVCLEQVTAREYERLVERLGEPTIAEGDRAGQVSGFAIVAMGKFGGSELNYSSDLDLIFLYEGDGQTVQRRRRGGETTNNQHFFSELGQKIIKSASQLGPYGRLYEIDPRLRPTGKSGSLAISLAEFARYFAEGHGALWERQALCKARPLIGNADVLAQANEAVGLAIYSRPWEGADAQAIGEMRQRLQDAADKRNLKRGPGGMVDIEFLVQMMQLEFGEELAEVRQPNTLLALDALRKAGKLSAEDHEYLTASYGFMRRIEARLRLMNTTARDDLPVDAEERAKLARMLGFTQPEEMLAQVAAYREGNRARWERYLSVASA